MTLHEFYQAVGGDYEDVLERLGDEPTIKLFVKKFPEDASYMLLQDALQARDMQSAFRAAHTLKGISRTLGLGDLAATAVTLTEILRKKEAPPAAQLKRLATAYAATIAAIHSL